MDGKIQKQTCWLKDKEIPGKYREFEMANTVRMSCIRYDTAGTLPMSLRNQINIKLFIHTQYHIDNEKDEKIRDMIISLFTLVNNTMIISIFH